MRTHKIFVVKKQTKCYTKDSGGFNMGLSYNKLWKLLIDKNINKTELHELTGISQSTIVKLSKGENVNTDVLERICKTLNCKIEDIVEYMEDENNGDR